MNTLGQSEGSTAYERFCNNRKLNIKSTTTIYEFAAFIDYGLSAIRTNMKHPDAHEVVISAHTKHQIDLLTSDHGELLLKAMILKRYSSRNWPLLKLKKYTYLCTAFVWGIYYDFMS